MDTFTVGAVKLPVNVGEAILAFKFNADWVAVETGLFASVVLSTLPRPTIDFVIPLTVPVKAGEANVAYLLCNDEPFSYMAFCTYKLLLKDTSSPTTNLLFTDKSPTMDTFLFVRIFPATNNSLFIETSFITNIVSLKDTSPVKFAPFNFANPWLFTNSVVATLFELSFDVCVFVIKSPRIWTLPFNEVSPTTNKWWFIARFPFMVESPFTYNWPFNDASLPTSNLLSNDASDTTDNLVATDTSPVKSAPINSAYPWFFTKLVVATLVESSLSGGFTVFNTPFKDKSPETIKLLSMVVSP